VRFPTVKARDLEGRVVRVPDDLPSGSHVFLIAFQRWHQPFVDGWRTFLDHAEERFPGMSVWELPILSRAYAPARLLIDGGMRSGVPDPEIRRSTLTVYTDVRSFQSSLEIASTETICVMLIDGAGEVSWNTSGPLDQHGADGIIQALVRLEADSSAGDAG
jgi:hypothetical protein